MNSSSGQDGPSSHPTHVPVGDRKLASSKSIRTSIDVLSTPQEKNAHAQNESLDYESVINVFYEQRMAEKPKKKRFWGYTGGTVLVYITTIIGGLLIGLFAHLISFSTSKMTTWKNGINQEYLLAQDGVGNPNVVGIMFGIQTAYSVVLIMLASLLVIIAPVSIGAGVTLVMQYLNGSYVYDLFSWKTLIAKIIGTAFSVGSNVPVGPEGPMVHIGAAINYRLLCLDFTKMGEFIHTIFPCCNYDCLKDPHRMLKPPPLKQNLPVSADNGSITENGTQKKLPEDELDQELKEIGENNLCRTWDSLQTDHEHTEMVAAGAGAGLAAAFGSPIGGVLYSFEEASTYFGKKTLWRSLICAIVAVYILQMVRNAAYPGLIEFNPSVLQYKMKQWITQTPMLIITCIVTSLMGSIYIKLREYFNGVRGKFGLLKKENRGWRIFEAIFFTIIFVFVAYAESIIFGQCVQAGEWPKQYADGKKLARFESICGNGVLEYTDSMDTPKVAYNDLLTLFFGTPEGTIKKLIAVGTSVAIDKQALYSTLSLLVFSVTYLFFMALISSTMIPAGLFMPSIMVGGSFGLAFGQFIKIVWEQNNLYKFYDLGIVQPGLYALVGATSTLGGLFRASISLIVIMIEGTGGIDYIYGVLLAVLISNLVAKVLHAEGVYETEIENRNDIHHLRHDPPRALYHKKVEEIMQSELQILPIRPTVRQVMTVLQRSMHNGYPIVSSRRRNYDNEDHDEKYGKLEGMVLRHQLIVLLENDFYCDSEGIMLHPDHRENFWKYGRILDYQMRQYFFRRHQSARVHIPSGVHPVADQQVFDLDNTFIDLALFMHLRPVCVTEGSYASSAHTQFVSMRMRHMPVVDQHFNLVGLLTRKDLDKAAGHGHWRHNPLPSPDAHTDDDIDTPLLQD